MPRLEGEGGAQRTRLSPSPAPFRRELRPRSRSGRTEEGPAAPTRAPSPLSRVPVPASTEGEPSCGPRPQFAQRTNDALRGPDLADSQESNLDHTNPAFAVRLLALREDQVSRASLLLPAFQKGEFRNEEGLDGWRTTQLDNEKPERGYRIQGPSGAPHGQVGCGQGKTTEENGDDPVHGSEHHREPIVIEVSPWRLRPRPSSHESSAHPHEDRSEERR